jgi:twitching motility protein PilU
MAYADSPTNLIWRLHNDMSPVSKIAPAKEEVDAATFTDIVLEVLPEDSRAAPLTAMPPVRAR